MMTRRTAVLALGSLTGSMVLPPLAGASDSGPVLGDDGLYHQPWFLESFLELADDLSESAANGKRFAVIWELKGCPYCRETHLVNFARPDILAFIRTNFEILQLNLIGSRKVVDFDGEELSERKLARKYSVSFTPTIQFFPSVADFGADTKPRQREVSRLAGYMKPNHFLKMFMYVEQRAYERLSFRNYLKQAT